MLESRAGLWWVVRTVDVWTVTHEEGSVAFGQDND